VRRLIAWGLSVPLILAGTEAAHSLAYRLAYPQAEVRWRMLSASGHGYAAYVPLAAGVVAAAALVSLLATAAYAARRQPIRPVPAWMFALLPPLAFTAQEYTERWLRGIDDPSWMLQQPTFRYGLLLQLPSAALAYLAARLLCRVAVAASRILGGASPIVVEGVTPAIGPPPAVDLPRLRMDLLGWSLRGPPEYGLSS
jgi:hypothetical protein